MTGSRIATLLLATVTAAATWHTDGSGASATGERPRVHARRESTTMVAVTLALPVGAAHEAAEEAGVIQLAARAVLDALAPGLDSLGARTSLRCGRGATGFTLLAPPATWRAATSMLTDGLSEPVADSTALAGARRRLVRSTRLDNGNPTWQIRVVTRQALFGAAHPRARPSCGLPETIELIHPDTVAARARNRLRLDRAVAAVHGPVAAGQAAAFLRGLLGAAGAVRPTAPAVPVRDGTRAAERNTVTAWVGLAFPFDDVEGEALRLLGYRLREAIAPGPDRPGVLGVATEVERHPGGGALYVYFLSEPGDALAWSERVRDLVAETARAPLSTDVFAALLRRYRGVRFLELETPERRAEESARALLQGTVPQEPGAVDALTAARLRQAAIALGPPARGVVGPASLVEAVSP